MGCERKKGEASTQESENRREKDNTNSFLNHTLRSDPGHSPVYNRQTLYVMQ